MVKRARPIVKRPEVCGGDALIEGTRIPVWSIERWRQLRMTIDEILQSYPTVTREEILLGLKYAESNQDEIERAIWENEHDEDDV
jgi:uncharacterized protein (DUF433 family)